MIKNLRPSSGVWVFIIWRPITLFFMFDRSQYYVDVLPARHRDRQFTPQCLLHPLQWCLVLCLHGVHFPLTGRVCFCQHNLEIWVIFWSGEFVGSEVHVLTLRLASFGIIMDLWETPYNKHRSRYNRYSRVGNSVTRLVFHKSEIWEIDFLVSSRLNKSLLKRYQS